MNESELKDIFVSSIESGHIIDNKGGNLPFTNPEAEIRIKSEGYFGQFDLVLAVLQRNNIKAYQKKGSEDYRIRQSQNLELRNAGTI